MDKIVLTTEQLNELKSFIYSRGFRDDVVINEILDHFACKVEEVLQKHPTMLLSDAMREAHKGFGVLGFYVIQANFEKNTRSKYRKLYWQSIKSVLLSIPYLATAIIVAILVQKAYIWTFVKEYNHLFEQNDVTTILFLSYIGSMIGILIKFKAYRNYYFDIARSTGWWMSPFAFFPLTSEPDTLNGANIYSYILAVMAFILLISNVAQYRLLTAASVDYDEYKKLAE